MALAPDRYRQVDDELKRTVAYFEQLASELDEARPLDRHGVPGTLATNIASAIHWLRRELAKAQE